MHDPGDKPRECGGVSFASSLLRANGSRECAPDDRLREGIHVPALLRHGLLPPSLRELRRTSRRFAPRNDGVASVV